MLLAFELSKEHETLPSREVLACFDALGIVYNETMFSLSDGILVVDAFLSSPHFIMTMSKRLGMTNHIYLIMGESKVEEKEILQMVDNADIDINGDGNGDGVTFALRVKTKGRFFPRDLQRRAGEIIKQKGYQVDLTNPAKTFVLLLAKETCFLGLLLHSRDKKQFEARKPHIRPFFSPGVILPKFARCCVNLSRVKEEEVLLDPFCGTGGILIEAGMMGAKIMGIDVQEKMVKGAKTNLRFYGLNGELIVGDATRMALQDDTVDAIVTDAPYGRSSFIGKYSVEYLYSDAVDEMHRVLKKGGRIVFVANSNYNHNYHFNMLEKHQYRVHKSLNRYITVMEKK